MTELDVFDQNLPETATCLICGHVASFLASHFKKAHQITSDEYRARFPGARIRSEANEARRKAVFKVVHANPTNKGKKKWARCSQCDAQHEIAISASADRIKCQACKEADAKQAEQANRERFASLVEGEDYVSCVGCDYQAESLCSHIQSVHPEWVGNYPGQMTARDSKIRDKTHFKGRTLSDEVKAKMSANAGRWNKGQTVETDPRLRSQQEAIVKYFQENNAWNTGLTKETDVRVAASGQKQRQYWATNPEIRKEQAEKRRVNLTKEDFTPYLLKNGKVKLGRAIKGLGHTYVTLVKECERLGLETHNTSIKETACLESISKLLGNAPYEQEWSSPDFINPVTGGRFRYDGYFPSHNLMIEFHGYQHWVFPTQYIKDETQFQAQQERDRIKEELISNHPTLKLLVIREDEPHDEEEYLMKRLIEIGVLTGYDH